MINDQKPRLDEALIHAGKRGMRWGVRHIRPDEAERKERFGPRAKKYSKAAVNNSLSTGSNAAVNTIQASGKTSLAQLALMSAVLTAGSVWIKNRQDSLALDMTVDRIDQAIEEALAEEST